MSKNTPLHHLPHPKKAFSKEEAAATKQETIIIKSPEAAEDEALKPLFNAIVDGKLEPAVEVTKRP